ncbi:MAG TPA: biotin transporter BioY [Blastocatellia bacterium]|nr:biotin transporter BioY [Blastocatellia bacterium]
MPTVNTSLFSNERTRVAGLNRVVSKAIGVGLFVALTVASARVKVWLPFSPVPMTMQPMAVLLAGAILGPWLGALSQIIYLTLGLAGAPAFAGVPGAGIGVLLGPTGGYLMSYPPAAWVVGKLGGRSPGARRIGVAMLIGLAIIYAFGVARLVLFTEGDFVAAVNLGVAPFVVADLIKLAVAATIVVGLRGVARRQGLRGENK